MENNQQTNNKGTINYCPKCGTEIGVNFKFCPRCGHKIVNSSENKVPKANQRGIPSQQKSSNKTALWIWGILGIIGAVFIINRFSNVHNVTPKEPKIEERWDSTVIVYGKDTKYASTIVYYPNGLTKLHYYDYDFWTRKRTLSHRDGYWEKKSFYRGNQSHSYIAFSFLDGSYSTIGYYFSDEEPKSMYSSYNKMYAVSDPIRIISEQSYFSHK